MPLLKPSNDSNMFPGWHRWNIIGGCKDHACSYCYIKAMDKRFKTDLMRPRFKWDYLNDNLGSGKKIFCCSSGDAWGDWVLPERRSDMLKHCRKYSDNTYMYLSKNSGNYLLHHGEFPPDCILGVTVETNRTISQRISKAPLIGDRLNDLMTVKLFADHVKLMMSIEPVMDFDLPIFLEAIGVVSPDLVYIGADTGRNKLPEPSSDKVLALIDGMEALGIKVHQKSNLKRLIG